MQWAQKVYDPFGNGGFIKKNCKTKEPIIIIKKVNL